MDCINLQICLARISEMENNMLASENENHDLYSVLLDVLARLDHIEKSEKESVQSTQQRGPLAFKETSL